MSSDIGFEEAERRRLEFASKRRARHSISKGVEGVGRRSIFASHGSDGHDYMVKLAMEKLDADAVNRTATATELSVRQSTLRSSYFQRRTRKRRRMCLALSSLLPLLHRGWLIHLTRRVVAVRKILIPVILGRCAVHPSAQPKHQVQR